MNNPKQHPISAKEVLSARRVVSRFLRPTGLFQYDSLSRAVGAPVFVKHENHQPTGAFKIRGGINLIHYLKEEGVPGVLTTPPGHDRPTIGNSNGSILTAARWLGLKSVVVTPAGTHPRKLDAFRSIGAEVVETGQTPQDCQAAASAVPGEWLLPCQHLR